MNPASPHRQEEHASASLWAGRVCGSGAQAQRMVDGELLLSRIRRERRTDRWGYGTAGEAAGRVSRRAQWVVAAGNGGIE